MPRMSWGGGGDLSGLFASAFRSQNAQPGGGGSSAGDQYARQSQAAEQAAADQEAVDQWQHGLMSDDDFLAYLSQRVSATTNDAKEHEKWVKYEREYREQIEDSRARSAYENGGSINDYIGYLQGKLGKMQSGSQQYRDVQMSLNQLLDTRAQQDVQWKAQQVSQGISSGKYTYNDLLKVYQDALKSARPGSDIYKQISSAIDDTKATLKQNALQGDLQRIGYLVDAGKMGGAEAGRQIRALADANYKGDPVNYYKLLSSALQYETAAARGSGGGGGGSGASSKTLNAQIDGFQAQETRINDVLQQFKDGKPYAVDPDTGEKIYNTQANRNYIAKIALDNLTKEAAAYRAKSTPDNSAASKAEARKTKLVTDTLQPLNTMDAQTELNAILLSANNRLADAATLPDPQATLNAAKDIAKDLRAYAQNKMQIVKNVRISSGLGGAAGAADVTQRSDLTVPTPDFVSNVLALADAMDQSAVPGGNPDMALSILKQTTGKYISDAQVTAFSKAIGQQADMQGALQAGAAAYYVDPSLGITVVKKTTVSVPVVDPATGLTTLQPSAVLGDKNATRIFIDVNGIPTEAWAPLQDGTAYKAWVAKTDLPNGPKSGSAVPLSYIKAAGANWDAWVASGAVAKADADLGLRFVTIPKYTDANGAQHDASVWWLDTKTNRWYSGDAPIQWAALQPDGTIGIDDSGRPMLNWQAFATSGSVPFPYVGSHPRSMQETLNTGKAGAVPEFLARGPTGDLEPNSTGTGFDYINDSTAYYDPAASAQMTGYIPKATARSNWWDDDAQRAKATAALEKWAGQRAEQGGPQSSFSATGLLSMIIPGLGDALGGKQEPKSFTAHGMPGKTSSGPLILAPAPASKPSIIEPLVRGAVPSLSTTAPLKLPTLTTHGIDTSSLAGVQAASKPKQQKESLTNPKPAVSLAIPKKKTTRFAKNQTTAL